MSVGLFGEHPLAGAFTALDPLKVMDAVEADGRRCTGRFFVLNSYENRVYQLELDDESMVVGKFYRPGRWSVAAIEEEHRLLAELAEEEIPVACPLDLGGGRTVGTLTGEAAGIHYALFPRVGGRVPDELDLGKLRILGRLLARIHNVGAAGRARHRPRLTPETYGLENLRFLLDHDILPVEVRAQYRATVEHLVDRISPLFEGVPMHRVHGDCHRANLVWQPTLGPTFLDFDDLVVGPAAQDVWLLVPASDAEGAAHRAVLLEAYNEFRDFDPAWLALVEPLRALRYVHYATWIARRYDDPTFRRTFGDFGTLRWWQGQVQDLREQIARIDDEADRASRW